jgi:hypothetical protein
LIGFQAEYRIRRPMMQLGFLRSASFASRCFSEIVANHRQIFPLWNRVTSDAADPVSANAKEIGLNDAICLADKPELIRLASTPASHQRFSFRLRRARLL